MEHVIKTQTKSCGYCNMRVDHYKCTSPPHFKEVLKNVKFNTYTRKI